MSERPIPALEIRPIPAFEDNYLWLLSRGRDAVVVDPGDAAPVIAELERRQLNLVAILVTHHHPDHIGGLAALLEHSRVPVYGPRGEDKTIGLLSERLDDDDTVAVLGREFRVLHVPGHTLGHIAYYAAATDIESPVLLCGDTLFSGGCGRLFEGTPQQMHASLGRLAELPGATQVYCTHEYTTANLAFARAVEPDNRDLAEYVERVRQWRSEGQPSLPSSIELELRINPFLRTAQPSVRDAVCRHDGKSASDEIEIFARLRQWKDHFRAPPAP